MRPYGTPGFNQVKLSPHRPVETRTLLVRSRPAKMYTVRGKILRYCTRCEANLNSPVTYRTLWYYWKGGAIPNGGRRRIRCEKPRTRVRCPRSARWWWYHYDVDWGNSCSRCCGSSNTYIWWFLSSWPRTRSRINSFAPRPHVLRYTYRLSGAPSVYIYDEITARIAFSRCVSPPSYW